MSIGSGEAGRAAVVASGCAGVEKRVGVAVERRAVVARVVLKADIMVGWLVPVLVKVVLVCVAGGEAFRALFRAGFSMVAVVVDCAVGACDGAAGAAGVGEEEGLGFAFSSKY